MQKIVINACFGGFGLSTKAIKRYKELLVAQNDVCYDDDDEIRRDDPYLIQVVEEMGEEAADWLSKLKVIEIPDDVDWVIEEYDGFEHVAEAHRTWP